jgi:hypothetical protein
LGEVEAGHAVFCDDESSQPGLHRDGYAGAEIKEAS